MRYNRHPLPLSRSGGIWDLRDSFSFICLSSLCVALHSHVRLLTHTLSLHITHHKSHRYLRLDLHSGELDHWYAPRHTYCEELIVVPKSRSGEGEGEEKDVYLLASMFDSVKGRSGVAVFDGARKLSTGPVATAWLKHQLPHSLHGCYVTDEDEGGL